MAIFNVWVIIIRVEEKAKLNLIKENVEINIFYGFLNSFEGTNRLECNQYETSDKTASSMYADLESFIKKIDEYYSNSQKSFKTKLREHLPSVYSMSTIRTFNAIEKSMMYAEVKTTWNSFVHP